MGSPLDLLATTGEITVHTALTPARGVVIWVVVVNGTAYIRSYRGRRGKWYAGTRANPTVTLEVNGQSIPGRIAEVTDPAEIAAVSHAFAAKYAGSSYLPAMLAEEILATTLRLSF